MNAASPVVRARGVARRFGARHALLPVDLDVGRGETVALVGPNGAGKSTLLAILAGALAPTEGTLEYEPGVRIGWAPQRPAHYGRLSVRENLELFARLDGAQAPEAAAERARTTFELPDGDEVSANLSVGMRQRLNLALALVDEPDVLLLDEPTAALDPAQRQRLWDAVAARRDANAAIVFATQHLDEVEQAADRVLELADGAVVRATARARKRVRV